MIRLCPIAGLLVLASLPSAQDDPRNTIDFGTFTPGPGPVTRTLAGDFTEDWEPDVVLLDARVPKLSYASYLFDAATPIEPSLTSVSDIAALRGLSLEGREILLATDSRGLLAVPYNDVSGTFTAPVVIAAGSWADATPILATVDPGGNHVVFGIQGSQTFSSLVLVGAVFVAGPTFTTTNPVLEFVALDWDNDGVLEVVFRTALGLEVRELSGALIRNIAGSSLGAITTLTNGNGVDFVAWAQRTLPDTHYQLTVLNESTWNAPIVNTPIRVPEDPGVTGTPTLELDVRSMVSGELGGGGMDLVISHATNQSVYVLKDTKSGVGIDFKPLTDSLRFGLSINPLSPAGPNVAPAAVLQLNNNGTQDLAVVTNEDRELRVYVDIKFPAVRPVIIIGGSKNPETAGAAESGAETGGEGRLGGSYSSGTGSSGSLAMGMSEGITGASYDVFGSAPTEFFLDFNLPFFPNATHLQITLWEQDEGLGSPISLLENTMFPLGVCTGSSRHTAVLNILNALGANPRPFQFFHYRLVRMIGDQILDAQESLVGVCALETFPGEFNGSLSVRYLTENLQASGPFPVEPGFFTCTGLPDGGAILGVVYKDTLPPLPPIGTTPNPGPWEVVQIPTINH